MSIPEPNSMIIPAEPDYFTCNMSFPSSPESTPLSPALSSPLSPVYFPASPQDSYFLDAPMMFTADPQQQQQQQQQRQENRSVSTFINKLFNMVGDKRHTNLIAWSSSGRSFVINDSKLFSKYVLPEYFKHGNFSSFVRQLNMYGFRKINKSPRGKRGVEQEEVWEFSHPKFERDRPDLLCDIKRKAVESDVLRRETGDMQACFNMMQASQNNLLEQFRVLQDNFSNLLQGFEDLRKNQMQIQIGIYRLAEVEHVKMEPPPPVTQAFTYTPPVLVTSPQPNIQQLYIPNQPGLLFDPSSADSSLPPSPMSTGGMDSTTSSYF